VLVVFIGLFQINFFYPFLDHVINHLETRFPADLHGVMLASYLIPGNIALLTNEVETKLYETFKEDMPNHTEFSQEVRPLASISYILFYVNASMIFAFFHCLLYT
jgi:hypothetical protein